MNDITSSCVPENSGILSFWISGCLMFCTLVPVSSLTFFVVSLLKLKKAFFVVEKMSYISSIQVSSFSISCSDESSET